MNRSLTMTVLCLTLALSVGAPVAFASQTSRSVALKKCNDDYKAAVKKAHDNYASAAKDANDKKGKEHTEAMKGASKARADALASARKVKADCMNAAVPDTDPARNGNKKK